LIEPFLPIGRYGPYSERLREQFEGVIWRFRTGSQWREMPSEFGAWSTVYDRFAQWRDTGVFEALMEGMIAEAARRGQAELSLVSVDSTVARVHHDAAGMWVSDDVLAALEEAAERTKGAHENDKRSGSWLTERGTMPTGPNGGASGAAAARG
jgi:transposase